MVQLGRLKEYSPIAVRLGISIVFLLFGISQIFNGKNWLAWLPPFVDSFPLDPLTFVLFIGIFNFIVGGLLLIGLFTRLAALLGVLHLIGVISVLGYNDIAIRDFGLMLASLSIFLHGPDKWCLDMKIKKARD